MQLSDLPLVKNRPRIAHMRLVLHSKNIPTLFEVIKTFLIVGNGIIYSVLWIFINRVKYRLISEA